MFQINRSVIPTLAVAFTRANDPLSAWVALVRGGVKAVENMAFPTHAFVFTRDQVSLFATEETMRGLVENSLSRYLSGDRRIVCVYYWDGWQDDERRNAALEYLAMVRENGGRSARYDFRALLSFIPVIGKLFKDDEERQICSENVAALHKKFGAKFIRKTLIAPDELLRLMRESSDCRCVLNYYV